MPDQFELREIAPGVHAAVSDITGGAVGNAAIIDSGDKTIVVDSFITAQAAAQLREEAMRLTGRSIAMVVNTHWHSDHTWGNQTFADVPIIGTARTVELMIADAPGDLAAYEKELDGYIASVRAMLQSDDEAERDLAGRRLRGLEEMKLAAPGFRLTLPDMIFDGTLVIEGERRVELHTPGMGHTDSDTFVWLPDERVIIAGDLCWNAIHPKTSDGHPQEWADALGRILALSPAVIHPGHGRSGDAAVPEALIPYLHTIAGYVDQVRAGTDSGSLAAPAGTEHWDGIERMRAGVASIAAR